VLVPATTDPDLTTVQRLARAQLSAYKVPTRWVIATVDQIPTLPSGKIDRKGLLANIVGGVLPTGPAAP
jgi:non-ribosomal peptide synthetase component E (peptide arylation enzyme)